MDKFLVIEGKVLGGHTIKDLGLDVPYQEEVVLNSDRANWSRDLNLALQQGLVIKKKVISSHDFTAPVTTKPTKRSGAKRPEPKKKHTTKAPSPEPQEESASDTTAEPDEVRKENEELRSMNQMLLKSTNRLMEQQEAILQKLSEYMDRPERVVTVNNGGGGSGAATSSGVTDDTPTFIPSKIRSGKAKASNEVKVQSEAKEGSDQLNKASAALKALREQAKKDGSDD